MHTDTAEDLQLELKNQTRNREKESKLDWWKEKRKRNLRKRIPTFCILEGSQLDLKNKIK